MEKFENLQFGQKSNLYNIMAKEGVVVKEITAIQKKLSTLNQDDRKHDLRAYQELARPYSSQLKDFEKRTHDTQLTQRGPMKKVFWGFGSVFSFLDAQRLQQPWYK